MKLRRSKDRGHAGHGWLESFHTFSFADYHDPAFMGFRALRVINEDRVQPGQGFGTHSHRDMEIVTYVLEGALEHKDSMGNSSVIRPGEVQRMSAGTGVSHSEFNHSHEEPVHFLQIWIIPEKNGIAPSYEQRMFAHTGGASALTLVASRDGRDGSVTIHQDVDVYAGRLPAGGELEHGVRKGRALWVQVARGIVQVGAQQLVSGDGAATDGEHLLRIRGTDPAEILLFDLA